MARIPFGALPCRKRNLMTARVSIYLKSRASLTSIRACFLPGRAKDLSAPRYDICIDVQSNWSPAWYTTQKRNRKRLSLRSYRKLLTFLKSIKHNYTYQITIRSTAINTRKLQTYNYKFPKISATCNTSTRNIPTMQTLWFLTRMLKFYIFTILAWDLVYLETKRK